MLNLSFEKSFHQNLARFEVNRIAALLTLIW